MDLYQKDFHVLAKAFTACSQKILSTKIIKGGKISEGVFNLNSSSKKIIKPKYFNLK